MKSLFMQGHRSIRKKVVILGILGVLGVLLLAAGRVRAQEAISTVDSTVTMYDIYVYDLKSGETRQVTFLAETGEYNPSWSQNGKYIAHDVVYGDGSQDLFITNVTTGESVPLKGGEDGNDAAWSPNGQWIAFDRRWTSDPDLYLVSAKGGKDKLLYKDAISPHWSPNSQRIVFQDLGDGGKLKTIGLKGKQTVTVAAYGENPSWSPNGKWIVYQAGGDLWKVQVDRMGAPLGEPIQLTSLFGNEDSPTWSENSQTVYFGSDISGEADLWSVPAAGGTPTWVNGAWELGDYDPDYGKHALAYGGASGDSQGARPWAAFYTYDLAPGSLAEGTTAYYFDLAWTLPEPGSISGQNGEIVVSSEAVLYEGQVLLGGGPVGIGAVAGPEGYVCAPVSVMHPQQAARFFIGWATDDLMAYPEAAAFFDGLTAKALWGTDGSAGMERQEVFPLTSQMDQWGYICSFAAP